MKLYLLIISAFYGLISPRKIKHDILFALWIMFLKFHSHYYLLENDFNLLPSTFQIEFFTDSTARQHYSSKYGAKKVTFRFLINTTLPKVNLNRFLKIKVLQKIFLFNVFLCFQQSLVLYVDVYIYNKNVILTFYILTCLHLAEVFLFLVSLL